MNKLLPVTTTAMSLLIGAPFTASAQILSITREIVFDQHLFQTGDGKTGPFTGVEDAYTFADTASIIIPAGTYDRIELVLTVSPGEVFVADPLPVPITMTADVLWRIPGGGGGSPTSPVGLSYTDGTPNLPSTATGLLSFGGTEEVVFVAVPEVGMPSDGFSFSSITLRQGETATSFPSDTEMFFDRATLRFNYRYDFVLPNDPGTFTSITPEPSSLGLLGLSGLIFIRRRRP